MEELQAELAALSLENLRAKVPLGALAEEGHLRLFQWNVSDFTVGGDEAIFAERLATSRTASWRRRPTWARSRRCRQVLMGSARGKV